MAGGEGPDDPGDDLTEDLGLLEQPSFDIPGDRHQGVFEVDLSRRLARGQSFIEGAFGLVREQPGQGDQDRVGI